MISFLAAFSLECLLRTANTYESIPSIAVCVLAGALVVWCVSSGWDRGNSSQFKYSFRKSVGLIIRKVKKRKGRQLNELGDRP